MTNKFNRVMDKVREGMVFAFFEVTYLCFMIADIILGDGINTWYLWLGLLVGAGWVVTTSLKEAQEQAYDHVLDGDILITDFMVSATVLTLIAIVMVQAGAAWYFPAVILLAAGQNVRYIYLANKWMREFSDRQRARSTDDNL